MDIETYRRKAEEQFEQTKAGFRGHLAGFVGVNAGLAGIWLATGAEFPWFLIPLFAWGIGIATNFDELLRKKTEVRELQSLGSATTEELESYQKLTKARAKWRKRLVSTGATTALLFVINMITSPSFPWFLFPAGGMAIGLFSHYPRYRAKAGRHRDKLAGGGTSSNAAPSWQVDPKVDELRTSILAEARDHPGFPETEVAALLDGYLNRLSALRSRRDQLEALLDDLAPEEARKEQDRLQARLSEITDNDRRREYENSLEALEKQLKMATELSQETELIDLRLASALSSLRQLRVEIARSEGRPGSEQLASMEELRRRSEELRAYLGDLRRAYDDLTP